MLPNDILNLIYQYNEVGTMLASTDNIYFFNGKRFEFCCKIPPMMDNDVMFVNGKIYCWSGFPCIWQLKNAEFVQIPSKTNLCTQELLMWDSSMFICQEENSVITIHNNLLVNKQYDVEFILDEKQLTNAMLVKVNDVIYIFAVQRLMIFNLKSKTWRYLDYLQSIQHLRFIRCINDIIYFFHEFSCDLIFDTKLDQWQIIETIEIPK